MKWFRRISLVIAVLLLAGVLLYWFLPASVAVPFVASRAKGLVLDDLSGTLWDGRAGRVATVAGRELGSAHWQLGRDAIFGRLHLDLHLDGQVGRFDGHLEHPDPDHMVWSGVNFRLDAAALAGSSLPRELAPMGVVEGNIPRAELQGNWPVALDANVNWRAAAVRTPDGYINLGDIGFKAASDNGVLHATVADNGKGTLAVDAEVAASPLGWRLQGKLAPRIPDTALSHLIARFGPVGRDGSVNLQRKAGLAPSITP